MRKGIKKLKDENIRLKTKYKYIKVIKVTDNLYNRKQIWQVETRKLRENINTNSSQKMINWTKYYEALGTEEDTSSTINIPEQSQSAIFLPTHSRSKAKHIFIIT